MSMNNCDGCIYLIDTECHRYPPTHNGYPFRPRGCGEFKEIEKPRPQHVANYRPEVVKEQKPKRGRPRKRT